LIALAGLFSNSSVFSVYTIGAFYYIKSKKIIVYEFLKQSKKVLT